MGRMFMSFLFWDILIALGLVSWHVKTRSQIAKAFSVACIGFVVTVIVIVALAHIYR